MSYRRDILSGAGRRYHDYTFDTTIDVYEPSESWQGAEGYDVTYPGSPNASYEATIDTPEETAGQDDAGTTVDVDVLIHVRDDTGQQWTEYGDSGEAAVQVEATDTGERYEVVTVVDERDGRQTLAAVDV